MKLKDIAKLCKARGLFLSHAMAQVLNEVDKQVNAEPDTDPETGEIV